MLLFLELNKDLDVDMFYIEEMKGHQVLCQWNLLIYFRWTAYRGRKAFIILLPYNLLGNKPHSIGLQGCQVFICELFLFSWIPQWVKITYPQKMFIWNSLKQQHYEMNGDQLYWSLVILCKKWPLYLFTTTFLLKIGYFHSTKI